MPRLIRSKLNSAKNLRPSASLKLSYKYQEKSIRIIDGTIAAVSTVILSLDDDWEVFFSKAKEEETHLRVKKVESSVGNESSQYRKFPQQVKHYLLRLKMGSKIE